MQTEGSLPQSQVPATCPYPVPARSSPHPHILLPEDLSHLRLGLPSGLFPSGFPTKTPVYASPLPHTRYMPRPLHSFRFYHPHNTGWEVQIIQLLIMQFPPLPCYPVPSRPKYSPQHSILEHPQPAFLHQCQRPSFTPIQNNRQNYSSDCTAHILKNQRNAVLFWNCNSALLQNAIHINVTHVSWHTYLVLKLGVRTSCSWHSGANIF